MAATGASALTDSVFFEIVESRVIDYLKPALTNSRSFIRFAQNGPSLTSSFPKWGDPGVATAPANDITDITNTAMSDTQVSITAAEVGFRIDLSDLVRAVHPADLVAEASKQVSWAIMEKWETDVAALMDDFSNTTPAGGTLSGLDLLAAVSALEQRDVPGPYMAYLDPKQSGELRAEIATTNASYAVGRDGEKVRPFGNDAYFGDYMGLPIWHSSLTVTTSGSIGGAVFQAGEALGAREIWGPRLEQQRDASLRALEIVGTAAYGLAELDDERGQTVTSVA